MKRRIWKQAVYFGIFSILIFSTFEVFAMRGGGHGSHGGGMPSGGGMQGHMDGNRSSGFQHMDRQIDRDMDQHMNRNMDRGMDQDMNRHIDRDMDQDMNRNMGRDMDQDMNRNMGHNMDPEIH